MPPEPLPWDRKDFIKERKHDRSESVGSVARWRDSSHHRDFHRWGSAEFRRPPGHGKQGGWHLFSEESGHGYAASRSGDKMVEEDSRPSISRGDGKYGRSSSRENRVPFGQRDWRGHSWETSNGSPNFSRRPPDVNNDQRSVDDALAYSSHPHSDSVNNTWDQHHLKDQHDKMGGVNGLATGPRGDRDNSLGATDWKPLKWTRSGSLSSRGSGFSHTNSSRSMGAADSYEVKVELQPKSATANESHSGEAAAACVTSSAPCEDTTSRKKPRLGWGEGLAKYEKKKVEGPEVSVNKDGPVSSTSNMEACNVFSPNVVDKSPKVTGFSDCASPATPSSVACSSSPGVDDKVFSKTANVDNDFSNLTGSPAPGSPAPGSQNHLQKFSFNLHNLDIYSLNNLGSSIIELVQSDDPSSVDSGLGRSSKINKLLIWKADISKVLEMTETEIDSLENELKSLKSEPGDKCPPAMGSQVVGNNEIFCEDHAGVSHKVPRPVPLKIVSSDEPDVEKMPQSNNLHGIHENAKEEDIDSPGTATSKFVEPLPSTKAVLSCEARGYDKFSVDLNAVQSTSLNWLVPCTTRRNACGDGSTSMDVNDSVDTTSASLCYSSEDTYNAIISSNKEFANRAHGVFAKLLPKESCKINVGASSSSCTDGLIMEKIAEKLQFAKFKERVIALKFKAFHHLWKEDMRLLSIKKCRQKSHKKNELSVRTTCIGNQKNRSSIRSRFTSPAGNHLSLVPTSEIINFTSTLLSESQVKVQRNTLKMPALILDEKEKLVSKFISSNGLIEDPLAMEKEKAMINPWTSEEREIFLEKFATFGKDFRKLASFLDHKTTADCVEFYYKNHKSDCFVKLKKQGLCKLGKSFSAKTTLVASGKKWNREVNAASLEMLSAASMIADGMSGNKKMRSRSFLLGGYGNVKKSKGEDSIVDRSNSFDIHGDERETAAAADVLAGICGSLASEAMSSCTTSSVDPVDGNKDRMFLKANPLCKKPLTPDVTQNDVEDDTCSDESSDEMDPSDWTDDEKAALLQAVSSFGKDFAKIARCVGTKSQDQCKVFFSKARKCLRLDLMPPIPGNDKSLGNDDANGGGSDTDDACVVETGSAVGTDKSGTKTDDDLPSMNAFRDESNPVEARNLSAELNESKEINLTGVDLEDRNLTSDASAIKVESKLGSDDGSEVVLGSPDKSASVSGRAAMIMSGSIEVEKEKANKLGGTEVISAPEVVEWCECRSVSADRPASEVSFGGLGNDLKTQRVLSPHCFAERDDKHEADTGVIELKSSVQNSSTTLNVPLSSVNNSCSGLSFGTENKHVSVGKPPISALSMKELHPTANSLLQIAAADVQSEKAASQVQLSSTCGIQGVRDMHCHKSISNGDHQFPIPGNHIDAVSILQGYPLQVPIKKEVNGNMKRSSSATELPLLSQKIDQADNHFKTTLQHPSDSERASRNGDVKLFGKILTIPSSTQKPNLTTKVNEENGTHHPKISNKSSGLKFTGHHNNDGQLKILKFDRNDHNDYLGLENVPMRSYGYWDGNRIQTGLSALPDSSILLAKYPAAFSNYPASSAKLEPQSLQTFAKNNNEWHLNGASAFTTRDINGSNAVIDYQMFRSRDGPKVQPFKHCQDVFTDMQRRNSFETMSSLQQQGRGVMGMNGVGRPGILVGGSCSGVSDPVAAIKMHYSNSDKYGGQTGSIPREDESWGGKGDLGR